MSERSSADGNRLDYKSIERSVASSRGFDGMMNHDERLAELLLRWEELRSAGTPVSTAELCRDCPELIPELEAQVRALCSMDALLRCETVGDTEIASNTGMATEPPESSLPGRIMSTVAKYQVVRAHARGGLGEVLVAYDKLLGRNVALKVIRQPHDRDPIRRLRFVREAEITSRLEHPGIVPVHGIGQDPEGRLCYAMRLISGETLHEAITSFHSSPEMSVGERERNLAFHQLLGRFVSVCNAVAYAHSHGILHRDLKPANIMLGAFGETLVVDWGLAKQLDGQPKASAAVSADLMETIDLSPTDKPDVIPSSQVPETQAGQAIGTPSFMSPEQSRGEPNLSPASDIYSLGATLYMLLTGKTPFLGRNVPEVVHAVQNGNFLPPRQVQPTVAKALEAVCLKAMALRPADRYATALELATDIERWLADQPVSAYLEPFNVRAGRWMRRHRLLVGSLSASLLVAILSLAVLLGFMSRANERLRMANEQEKQARAEAVTNAATATKNAALAENQSELALRSLQSVTFDIQRQLRNVPAAHKVRRKLLDTALRGLAEVATKLEQRPKIDLGLMTAHRDLGDVFYEVGSETEPNAGNHALGASEAALAQYQRAFDIAQSLADADPSNREAKRQLSICHDKLGDIHGRMGSTKKAMDHFQTSLDIREQLLAIHPNDEEVCRDVAVSLNRLGDLQLKAGAVEAARDLFQRAFDIRRKQAAKNDQDSELQRDLMISYNKIGSVLLRLGNTQQALDLFLEGLKLSRQLAEQDPDNDVAQRDLTNSYDRLGNAYWTKGDFPASADFYRKSLEICLRRAESDPSNTLMQRDVMQASEKMSDALVKLGKLDEAREHLEKMVTICEHLVAADPGDRGVMRDLAIAYANHADLLAETGKKDEAIEWYRKSLKIRQQRAAADPSDPRGPSDVAMGLTKLGDGLLAVENVTEALQFYAKALEIHKHRCDANPSDRLALTNLAAFHQRIGVACRRAGKFDQSAEHYEQGLQIAKKLSASDLNDVPIQIMMLTFYHSLGFLEQSRQGFAEAKKWYKEGLELAQKLGAAGKLVGEDATWVSYIQDALQDCLEAEKKSSESSASSTNESERA